MSPGEGTAHHQAQTLPGRVITLATGFDRDAGKPTALPLAGDSHRSRPLRTAASLLFAHCVVLLAELQLVRGHR